MVIGGILQSWEHARDSKEREIRLTHVLKLSKKDFIKIFSSLKEAKKAGGIKSYSTVSPGFYSEDEAGKYYDTVKAMQKVLEDEKIEVKKDIKRLSKKEYIKKYSVYMYPDWKYKVNGKSFYDVLGNTKYKKISHDEAKKIKNPGFFKEVVGLGGYESLLVPPPDSEALGERWEKENNKTSSKKTTSTKSNNLTGKLKELNKLYKDGALSKKEFTKAKNKLLK